MISWAGYKCTPGQTWPTGLQFDTCGRAGLYWSKGWWFDSWLLPSACQISLGEILNQVALWCIHWSVTVRKKESLLYVVALCCTVLASLWWCVQIHVFAAGMFICLYLSYHFYILELTPSFPDSRYEFLFLSPKTFNPFLQQTDGTAVQRLASSIKVIHS